MRCANCREELQDWEIVLIKHDVDFIPHGDRGHLIRIESQMGHEAWCSPEDRCCTDLGPCVPPHIES